MTNLLDPASWLPDWAPSWLGPAILVVGLMLALAFLLMPFSVFGVKTRLEAVEARLAELQAELRASGHSLPGPRHGEHYEDEEETTLYPVVPRRRSWNRRPSHHRRSRSGTLPVRSARRRVGSQPNARHAGGGRSRASIDHSWREDSLTQLSAFSHVQSVAGLRPGRPASAGLRTTWLPSFSAYRPVRPADRPPDCEYPSDET